jgi:hypothetical protein
MRVHLNPRQRQERVDEARHPRSLLRHNGQEAVACRRVVLGGTLQCLDEAAQRGKRRSELVARIRDKVDPDLIEALHFGEIS